MAQTEQPVKASLISQDSTDNIDFMYNPTELRFSRSMRTNPADGARTANGLPKVSFANPDPYSLSLSNIMFDTYEEGTNVMNLYINKLRQSVAFTDSLKRPPVYIFTWGSQEYLKCFVTSLTYRLTMFLPDGTPVRAVVDLSLQEIDDVTAS
jgi:Contractile injection system tube protein